MFTQKQATQDGWYHPYCLLKVIHSFYKPPNKGNFKFPEHLGEDPCIFQ